MRSGPVGSHRFIRLLAPLALCVWLAAPAAPADAAPEDLCSAQVAAAQALEARIEAHNAQPHVFEVPRQAAEAAAYDAEAAELNAEKATTAANLQTCLDAMDALAGAGVGAPQLKPVPEDVRSALDQAKKGIPDDWKPPAAPAPGRNWRTKGTPVRPLYDILRRGNPGDVGNATLQGRPRPLAGTPDPAYPSGSGRAIGTNADGESAVSPDHIVPLAEIINMPGFTKLSPQNMYVVTRAPVNLQWLSFKANLSKSSRSVAGMSGVDPQWQAEQVELENQIREQLQDIINKLLRSQG